MLVIIQFHTLRSPFKAEYFVRCRIVTLNHLYKCQTQTTVKLKYLKQYNTLSERSGGYACNTNRIENKLDKNFATN